MKNTKKLPTHPIEDIDHLTKPDEYYELTTDSSALEIFTDYKVYKPVIIEQRENVLQASELMRRTHTTMRIVVNDDEEFVGILTSQDLIGTMVAERVAAGITKEDILVKHVMTPRSSMLAINKTDLENASIGDVITTLQSNGEEYCLVVDKKEHRIRGFISANEIAQRIHLPVTIQKRPSFIELFRLLNHR